MSVTGKLTKTGKTYKGFVADLGFDEDVALRENPRAGSSEKAPQYVIMAKSPRGREIECGAAWEGESEAGNFYLSLSVSFNGHTVRCNAVQVGDSGEDNLTILPFSDA